MKLISWNVNGLRSVRQKGLDDFLETQCSDVVCLQEIKIDQEALTKLAPLPCDYKSHSCSASRRGYSGVMTLFSPAIHKGIRSMRFGLGNDTFDAEGRFVISEHNDFTLYNMYFPSGTSGEERQAVKYRFLDYLLEHLQSLSKKERGRVILTGDFNICHRPVDIHHPETAERLKLTGYLPEERQWMDRLFELGFVDSFRHVHGDEPKRYSWWSFRAGARKKNLGWRLDYFIVGQELSRRISGADILQDVTGSDHCPVVLELED